MVDESSLSLPVRSTAFRETPKPPPKLEKPESPRTHATAKPPIVDDVSAPKRDDRLALVEDLEVGPHDHKAPFDDPNFERLEPNSGIRLRYAAPVLMPFFSN